MAIERVGSKVIRFYVPLAAYLTQAGLYPEYREEAEAARALAWLAAGEQGQAAIWAESVLMEAHGLRGELARLTAARVQLALGKVSASAAALGQLAAAAAAAGRWSRAIETQAVLAAARYQQDDTAGALEALGRALAAAAPRGHVRSILEAGLGISEDLIPGLLGLGIRQDAWFVKEKDYAKSLLTQAQTLSVWVDLASGFPVRIPKDMLEALSPAIVRTA